MDQSSQPFLSAALAVGKNWRLEFAFKPSLRRIHDLGDERNIAALGAAGSFDQAWTVRGKPGPSWAFVRESTREQSANSPSFSAGLVVLESPPVTLSGAFEGNGSITI